METKTGFEVKETLWAGKTFITKKDRISFDKLTAFFTAGYAALYQALQKAGIVTNEPPFAIYYNVDEKKNETELAAAVAVNDAGITLDGFETLTIPAAKALKVTYFGAYDNMHVAYDTLERYMKDHNIKMAWMLEQYFSDPMVEKDPAKWRTDIYFILKD